jgi:hypothetical protein
MTNLLAQISSALIARAALKASGAYVTPIHIGDLGEDIYAAMNPTYTRMPACHKGYDFLTPDGTRIQLKTWSSKKRTHDKIAPGSCDRHVRLIIDLDAGTWHIAFDVAVLQAVAA